MPDDLPLRPAHRLAAEMAAGSVSPVELVDACLERIERIDGGINAFVVVLAEQARAQARESEARLRAGRGRPLEGVPIPIKDEMAVAGVPMTFGSAMATPLPSPVDGEPVARLRAAGAVFLGKTTLPELGTVPTTEGRLLGACHNPWDRSRTAGGSSGGAAAAVAAGMAPVAHGSDGGGSLRIPASCCGLFTVKPSRGRISRAPLIGDTPLGLVTDGFITRSVLDNALLLDAVQGPAPGDPSWAPPPARPYADEVATPPGRLRIGWTAVPPIDTFVDPACAAAVADAAELCASLGHQVVELTPEWRSEALLPDFLQVWAATIGWVVELLAPSGGGTSALEPHNRALWEAGRATPVTTYLTTMTRLQTYARRVLAAWREVDVLLTPSLAEPPLPLGTIFEGVDADPLSPVTRAAVFTPFTPLVNVTGQPAASLPLAWHDGLPVGVQAIGRPADEATLFRLSAQLEQARPWAGRLPPPEAR
ncbi:MAG TPA: amidase [Candidatus Dormibacteraeota bacterium]